MARVMIVDDDRTTVSLLKTLLEIDDFVVDVVMMGQEVLPRMEETAPDVILMDYHLTDMYGVDVLRAIRAHGRFGRLPVVIASGMNVKDEVMAAGANAFLIKPYEPDRLPILFYELIQS